MTGGADKAFKCDSETVALGNQMVGEDDYKLTLRMKNLMIQGFGVTNGSFSKGRSFYVSFFLCCML